MNESSGQQIEQELNSISNAAVMTSKERSGYWAKLIVVSIPAILMVGVNIYFAFQIRHFARPVSREFAHQYLSILVFSSALFLSIPLVFIYKIFRRRLKTGSCLPAGEELIRSVNAAKNQIHCGLE
jgi:ABC-type uncharacterized transport system fused permease/ATPase subunit